MRRLFLIFVLMFVPARAWADGSPPRIDLTIVGDAPTADSMKGRIASWFRNDPPVATPTRLASLDPADVFAATGHEGLRVWIMLGDTTDAHLVFSVQAAGDAPPRYLTSDVALENGLDEIGAERVAQVVYLSALGLWAGNLESTRADVEKVVGRAPEPVVVPRAAAVTAPTKESAPPVVARSSSLGLRVGAEYAVVADGELGTTQSVAGSIAVERRHSSFEVGARVRAAVLLPYDTTKNGVALDLRGLRFDAGAIGARKIARRVWLPAEVGLALQAVVYRTGRLDDSTLHASPGATDWQPLVYARAGARIDLGVAGLGIAATVALHAFRTHYDIEEDRRRTAIAVPWLVEPGLVAEASW